MAGGQACAAHIIGRWMFLLLLLVGLRAAVISEGYLTLEDCLPNTGFVCVCVCIVLENTFVSVQIK